MASASAVLPRPEGQPGRHYTVSFERLVVLGGCNPTAGGGPPDLAAQLARRVGVAPMPVGHEGSLGVDGLLDALEQALALEPRFALICVGLGDGPESAGRCDRELELVIKALATAVEALRWQGAHVAVVRGPDLSWSPAGRILAGNDAAAAERLEQRCRAWGKTLGAVARSHGAAYADLAVLAQPGALRWSGGELLGLGMPPASGGRWDLFGDPFALSALGAGLAATLLIEAINAHFGTRLPPLRGAELAALAG